jgi:hypothetical protein
VTAQRLEHARAVSRGASYVQIAAPCAPSRWRARLRLLSRFTLFVTGGAARSQRAEATVRRALAQLYERGLRLGPLAIVDVRYAPQQAIEAGVRATPTLAHERAGRIVLCAGTPCDEEVVRAFLSTDDVPAAPSAVALSSRPRRLATLPMAMSSRA